jgi:hypothetical protein
MSEYQLRINGKAIMYSTDMCSALMDKWVEECVKDPEACTQIEIVRVKEDIIYNQYIFHKIRQQHEKHKQFLSCIDKQKIVGDF